jgi:hypothetical protein
MHSGKNPLYLQRFSLCSPFVLNPEIQVCIVQAHIDSGALQMIPSQNKSYIAKSHKTQSTALELIYYAGDL